MQSYHALKNPEKIHTMQNMDKDSTVQIYLLYFSLFFFLWKMKSGGVDYMNVCQKNPIYILMQYTERKREMEEGGQ